jgi:hypothetical protein
LPSSIWPSSALIAKSQVNQYFDILPYILHFEQVIMGKSCKERASILWDAERYIFTFKFAVQIILPDAGSREFLLRRLERGLLIIFKECGMEWTRY